MKFSMPNLPVIVRQTWSRLAPRDRQALRTLVVALVAVLAFVGLWQPSQQRLAAAEGLYQQRLVQAGEVSRAQAPNARPMTTAPLSTQLSERAIADGLDLQQLEVQGDLLRLTLRGDARVLLAWLHRTEQDGAILQSLMLDKQGQALEAQVMVRAHTD